MKMMVMVRRSNVPIPNQPSPPAKTAVAASHSNKQPRFGQDTAMRTAIMKVTAIVAVVVVVADLEPVAAGVGS